MPCEKKCRSSGRATKRNARHGSHLVTIDAAHEHSNRINGRTRYHVKEGPKIHRQNNVVTERKEPSAKTLCLHQWSLRLPFGMALHITYWVTTQKKHICQDGTTRMIRHGHSNLIASLLTTTSRQRTKSVGYDPCIVDEP